MIPINSNNRTTRDLEMTVHLIGIEIEIEIGIDNSSNCQIEIGIGRGSVLKIINCRIEDPLTLLAETMPTTV